MRLLAAFAKDGFDTVDAAASNWRSCSAPSATCHFSSKKKKFASSRQRALADVSHRLGSISAGGRQ